MYVCVFQQKELCAEPKWPSAKVVIYVKICNVCFAWCVFHNRSQSFLAVQSNSISNKPPNFPHTNENNLYKFMQQGFTQRSDSGALHSGAPASVTQRSASERYTAKRQRALHSGALNREAVHRIKIYNFGTSLSPLDSKMYYNRHNC